MIIAKRNYERMILKEIEEIPDNALPHILKLLKLLKKSFLALEHPEKTESESTGLCGIWQDERTAEEIIEDIYSSRTGFCNREIDL